MVLLACGFLVSLTTPFVYQAVPIYLHRGIGLDRSKVTAALSLGQILEILALGVLPDDRPPTRPQGDPGGRHLGLGRLPRPVRVRSRPGRGACWRSP